MFYRHKVPKHVQLDTKLEERNSNQTVFSVPHHVPLSSVNCQSAAPLEGDVCYLVLRPLLDFSFCLFVCLFVWCLLHAVEMEKCSYNDKYYCFWHSGYKNRNMLLNVVQIVLENLCSFWFFVCLLCFSILFFKRAQT